MSSCWLIWKHRQSTELFVLMMDRVMKHAVHTETHLKPPPHPLKHTHAAHMSVCAVFQNSSSYLCINLFLYTLCILCLGWVAPDPYGCEQLCSSAVWITVCSYTERNISRAPEQRRGLGMSCFPYRYQHHDSQYQRPDNINPVQMTLYYEPASESLCVLATEFKHILTGNSGCSKCNFNHFSITGLEGAWLNVNVIP